MVFRVIMTILYFMIFKILKEECEFGAESSRTFYDTYVVSFYVLTSLKQKRHADFVKYLETARSKSVTPDCFDKCLKLAVENNNFTVIGVIMLRKPRNAKECLIDTIIKTDRYKFDALKMPDCSKSTLLLLLCYAVEKHFNDVIKVICENKDFETDKSQLLKCDVQISAETLRHLKLFIMNIKEYFAFPISIGCNPMVKNYEGVKYMLLNIFSDNKNLKADWRGLKLGSLHEDWLRNLTSFKDIVLSYNEIKTIPSTDILNYFGAVEKLNLSSNKLQEVPEELFRLPKLRSINLSQNKLRHLPNVKEWAPSLTTITLNSNLLESFPSNVEGLLVKYLYLAYNRLNCVPESICNLKCLETLDISQNVDIHSLPVSMGKLSKLTQLDLDGLTITDPPSENKTSREILNLLIEKLRNSKPYYKMKLMIIGFPQQGKTTLLKRLKGDNNFNLDKSTQGIDIEEVIISFQKKEPFVFRVWDFAGQEEYFATHQCFLSSSCLYLLVWDVTKKDECIQLLQPWFENLVAQVKVFYIIVVGTKLDLLNSNHLDKACNLMKTEIKALIETIPAVKTLMNRDKDFSSRLNICFVSSDIKFHNYNRGIQTLKKEIYILAETMTSNGKQNGDKIMGKLVPQSYLKLEEEIIEIKKKEKHKIPIISREELILIGKHLKSDFDKFQEEDLEPATKFLMNAGTVLCFDGANEDLGDIFFINPSWVFKLMSKFITVDAIHTFVKNGILEQDKIMINNLPPEYLKKNFDCLMGYITNSKPCYKMKLIIIGFSQQGKTTLLKRLKNCTSYVNQSTHGINIEEVIISFQKKEPFIFQVWDFAEQQEYFTTHQCFLSSSSLYLLVWDVTKKDECIQLLQPWFENLVARVNFFYIIVVGTKLDLLKNVDIDNVCNQMKTEIEELIETIPAVKNLKNNDKNFSSRIKVCFVSLETKFHNYSKDIEKLKTEIYLLAETMTYDGKQNGGKIMGKLFPQIYTKLEEKINEIKKQKENNNEVPIISREEFISLAKSLKCDNDDIFQDDDLEPATKFLMNTGTILYCDGANKGFQDIIFINPSWVCKLMSAFIAKDAVHTFVKNGILEKDKFTLILKEELGIQNPDLIKICISLLSRLQVACKIDDHRVLIPLKLPNYDPKHALSINLNRLLTRYYLFSCIPNGFWAQFITRFLSMTKEMLSPKPNFETKPKVSLIGSNIPKDKLDAVMPCCEDEKPPKINETNSSNIQYVITSPKTNSTLNQIHLSQSRSRNIKPSIKDSFVFNDVDNLVHCLPIKCFLNNTETSNDSKNSNSNSSSSSTVSGESFFNSDENYICRKEKKNDEDDEIESQLINELSNNDEEYQEHFNDYGELNYLLDNGYLSFWNQGIIFNHPQLSFSVQQLPISYKADSKTIEISVTKSSLGYRVLSYVVDHIRTLLKECFGGLLMSDSQVISSLACPICTTLGLNPPYLFNISNAFKKFLESSDDNTCNMICKGKHKPRVVNIAECFPDLTFQDLPKTMKCNYNDIYSEKNEECKLGEGEIGKVYSGLFKNKIRAAIKFYKFNMDSLLNQFYEVRQEILMLSKLRHHLYIIQFLGFSIKPKLCAVIEYARHGTLSSVIHKRSKFIPRIVKFRICQQIASALAFMHKKCIIHCNIKSDNVLLFSLKHNAKINIKLTYFCTANIMSPSGLKTFFGTKGYTAPEMIMYQSYLDEYTSSVDIYSFGMVFYELIAHQRPFYDFTDAYEINNNVLMGFRPKFFDISDAFYGLVHLTKLMIFMWHQEPSKRPPAKDILNLLLSPTFQLVFGLKMLSSTHNPCDLCYIISCNTLWITCNNKEEPFIIVINMESFKVVQKVKIEVAPFSLKNFYISSITPIGDKHVCVVLRTFNDVILVYKAKNYSVFQRYKIDGYICSISANMDWVCFGFDDGRCSKVTLKSFLNGNMLNEVHDFKLKEMFSVTSSVLLSETFIWSAGCSFILCNLEKNKEERKFIYDIDRNVKEIVFSFDEKLFFISYQDSTEIHIYSTETIEVLYKFNCHNDILKCSPEVLNVDLIVTCMCSVDNMLWVGTGSGHILIYEVRDIGGIYKTKLLQTLHPYAIEMQKLLLVILTQTRQDGVKYVIVSIGKELNKNAFGFGSVFEFDGYVPKDQTAIDEKLCEHLDNDSNDGKVIIVWHVLQSHQYKNLIL
ncbi:leucine-rich repeat serine/threonine-protein kinase 2 isoform X2 [Hydra vulgaris]|uniref:leucine-rich repeat serine/threonine-protein kinase 2 isoform X2 n=1 Tax=Hydra vulgaris TaxID=6087 RepID=UPI0032EA536A